MLATRENVKVVIRFRPANKIEISKENQPECKISSNDRMEYDTINNNILIGKKKNQKQWGFDRVLAPSITQKEVFQLVAQQTCKDVVNGYNGTIFVYGQTGSGKTYSMYGPEGGHGSGQEGLIPRSATYIFDALREDEQIETYRLTCSFLEIYQEKSRDLLNKSKKQQLKIRLNKRHETIMQGLMEHEVSSVKDIMKLIDIAISNRAQASTSMNATSSRSHMLLRMQLVTKLKDGTIRIGSCNFADLAGSEKVKKTGARGTRLDEAKAINKSLTILGQVILALSKQAKHVPFRDSTLTHILRDSLGGNCKTTLIVCTSPHVFNRTETINSLRFGRRCKLVQNKASVNRVFSNDELMKKLAILETQNAKLEEMLKKKAFEKFKNSELPKQIEALKKEIEKLKKRIKELEMENDGLNNKMQTLQRKNMELEDKQTGDINKINELNKEIEALNNELYSMKNSSAKDKQDKDAMSSQSQILMDKLKRVEGEKNELLKNVNKLNIEMEYLNQQKLEGQKEKIEMIKKMQNDRNEMEGLLKEKDKLLKESEKEIKKLMAENENNLKLLAEKDKLLEDMEKIREQNNEWENLNNVLNGEKDKLNKMVVTLEGNNNKLNEEINEFKNELGELNKEKMSMKEEQLQLQNENKKLNDENKELNDELKQERDKFEKDLNEKDILHQNKLEEMREKFKNDLKKLKEELSANHEELIKLKEEQLRAEYDAILKNKQLEYESNINGKVDELNKKYEDDLAQLKQELFANYSDELNKFKKELNELNCEKMSMKEDMLRLQNENKKLIDENKEIDVRLQNERSKFEQTANQKDVDIYNKQEEMRLKFQSDLEKQEEKLGAEHDEFMKLKEEQLRSEYDQILKNKQEEYKNDLNNKINELNKKYEQEMQQMKEELLSNYTQELNKLKKELNDLNQEKCAMEQDKLKLQNENKTLIDDNKEMEDLLKTERDKFDKDLNEKDVNINNKLEEMRLKFKADLKKQQEELKMNHGELMKLKEEQLRAEFDGILKNKQLEYEGNILDKESELNKKYEEELLKLKADLLSNYERELKKKEEEFELKYGELNDKRDREMVEKDEEFKRELNELTDEYNKKMITSQNEFVEQLNKFKKELNETHERAKNLEIQLSDDKMEINKLNELNDTNIGKMQQMQSEIDALLGKNNEFKEDLDKEKQKNKEKDEELLSAVNEIKKLEESHDKYLFEIDELTRLLEEARLAQDKMREDFRRKEELFGAKQKETLNLLRQQTKKVNEYGELISEKDDLLQSKEWQLRSKDEELLLRKRREEQEKKEMMKYLMQKSKSMDEDYEKRAKEREERRRKLNEQRKTLLTQTTLPNMNTLKNEEKKRREKKEIEIEDEEEEVECDIDSIRDNKTEVIKTLNRIKNDEKQARIAIDGLDKNITAVLLNNDFTQLASLRKRKKTLMKKVEKCRGFIKELQGILAELNEQEDEQKMNEIRIETEKKLKQKQSDDEMNEQKQNDDSVNIEDAIKTEVISFKDVVAMSKNGNMEVKSEEISGSIEKKEMEFKDWIGMSGLKESTIKKLLNAEIESLVELKEIENDLDEFCKELDIKIPQKIKLKKIIKNLPDKLPNVIVSTKSVSGVSTNLSNKTKSVSHVSTDTSGSTISSPPIIANSVSVDSMNNINSLVENDSSELKEDNEQKKEFDSMNDFMEIGNCDGCVVKAKFGRHKNSQKINMLLVLYNGNSECEAIDKLSIEFEANYCGILTYVKDIKLSKKQCEIEYGDLYQFNIPLVVISDGAKKIKNINNFNFITNFVLGTNVAEIKCNVDFNNCVHLYFNVKSKLEKTAFLKQWKAKIAKNKIVNLSMEKVKYCDAIDTFKEILSSQNIFLIHHRAIPPKGDMLYCACRMYSKDVMMEISIATPVKKAVVVVKSDDKFISMLCANLIKSLLCENSIKSKNIINYSL